MLIQFHIKLLLCDRENNAKYDAPRNACLRGIKIFKLVA